MQQTFYTFSLELPTAHVPWQNKALYILYEESQMSWAQRLWNLLNRNHFIWGIKGSQVSMMILLFLVINFSSEILNVSLEKHLQRLHQEEKKVKTENLNKGDNKIEE